MKKRIVAVIIVPIIGAILGYLLVTMLMNGWFSAKWQMIEKPPGEGNHLIAMSQDSLWVQNSTGRIYYNEQSSVCTSDCWLEVSEIPLPPPIETDDTTVNSKACAPTPPLMNVTEKLSECWRTMWVDHTYTFALRKDGSIYLWQAELYKEWSFVLLIIGVCGGALVFFIPVLLLVVVISLLDRRSRRATNALD